MLKMLCLGLNTRKMTSIYSVESVLNDHSQRIPEWDRLSQLFLPWPAPKPILHMKFGESEMVFLKKSDAVGITHISLRPLLRIQSLELTICRFPEAGCMAMGPSKVTAFIHSC